MRRIIRAKWYRTAHDQGYTDAVCVLAKRCAKLPDYTEATKWSRNAADRGEALAQFLLGSMYASGVVVKRDDAESAKWYRKAADQGDAKAQTGLGLAYDLGMGVNRDYAEARKWYRKAADQGDATGQNYLGGMYDNGNGVPLDYHEAAKWYRKAADQGLADAQYVLGVMCYSGEGVQQDYVQAYKWLNLAVSRMPASEVLRDRMIKVRDQAASKMSPAQIVEAQKLSREWKPQSSQFARRDDKAVPLPSAPPQYRASQTAVPLKFDRGIFVVPVEINGTMTLDFAIDSGASDVSVPADVISTLKRAGTIKESDFIGQQTYVLADGTQSQSATFKIRSLRVGGMLVENVRASVVSSQGSLLLGQSFLERFKLWSIDNTKRELLLDPR
jgi:clan AA aspartic protease (TIGR02281 family)